MEDSTSLQFEQVDEITRKIKATVGRGRIRAEFDRAYHQLSHRVKLKGFRAGKAPRALLEQLHGAEVRHEVASRLVEAEVLAACRQHEVVPVGQPQVDAPELTPEADFQFSATIAILPKPEVLAYGPARPLSVTVPVRKVTDKDVDEVIENFRKRVAPTEVVELRTIISASDIVELGVAVDIEGMEPGRTETITIDLAEPQGLPEEVARQLIGKEKSSSVAIDHIFSDVHPRVEFRGKKGTYRISVLTLRERKLPAADDQFAASLGFEKIESLTALRDRIRHDLEHEVEHEKREAVRAAILTKLAEDHQFKLPDVLIDDEIRRMLIRSRIVDPEKLDLSRLPMEPFRERLGESAGMRVKTTILIDRMIEAEKLTLTDEEITRGIEDFAHQAGVSIDVARQYLLERDRADHLRQELLRTKKLDQLEALAQVAYTDAVAASPS